jgi:hypothetical protein
MNRTGVESFGFTNEVTRVLTEQEVSRSWATLFKGEITSESLAKAESLLEELRPESPLRHRLGSELDELREMSLQG